MTSIILMLELINGRISYEQEVLVIVVVWMRMAHRDSYIWLLGPQFLEQFGKD